MTRMPNSPVLRNSLLLLMAAGFSAVGLAQAAAPATPAKAPAMLWIGDLDANHDGRITAQEAAAMPPIAKNFAAIDANHDGAITMSEVRGMWQAELVGRARSSVQMRMNAFAKADANHDGKLSEDEAKKGEMQVIVANFKAIDANHDGFVDKDEMLKASQTIAGSGLQARGQQMQGLFAKADSNHDSKLTKAEFTAAFPRFAPSFAFFDENHDGSVEPNEFALPPPR